MAATEHLEPGSATHVSDAPASRWRCSIWGAPALSVLLLVGLLVWWHGGGIVGTAYWPGQQSTFLSWNAAFAALPSAFWFAVTMLGDAAVLLPFIALWCVGGRPQVWAATLASVPAAGLMSAAVKHWAGVPRPAAVLDPALFNVIGPALQFNSFPSGHTISAFAAAAAVLATCAPRPRRGREWALIAGGLSAAAVVALSRVAVGAHWPLDLAAGAAIGWLAGLSGAALARRTAWWHWLFFGAGRRASAAGLLLWGPLLWVRPHPTLTGAAVLGLAGLCAVAAGLSMLLPHWASRVRLLPLAARATGPEASPLNDQRR